MFDIGFFELVLLAVIGLLVLGPERLPHAVRMGSAYLGKIRRTILTVREEFEREVNMQEMQQRVKEQMEKSGLQEAKDSLNDIKKTVEAPAETNSNTSDTGSNSIAPPIDAEPGQPLAEQPAAKEAPKA